MSAFRVGDNSTPQVSAVDSVFMTLGQAEKLYSHYDLGSTCMTLRQLQSPVSIYFYEIHPQGRIGWYGPDFTVLSCPVASPSRETLH